MKKRIEATNVRTIGPRRLNNPALRGTLTVATKAAVTAVTLFLIFLLVTFAAAQVIPLVFGFVLSASGVSLDMPIETVLSFWIAPSLFLLGLLFVAALHIIKMLWRLRGNVINRVTSWAAGQSAPIRSARTSGKNTKTAAA